MNKGFFRFPLSAVKMNIFTFLLINCSKQELKIDKGATMSRKCTIQLFPFKFFIVLIPEHSLLLSHTLFIKSEAFYCDNRMKETETAFISIRVKCKKTHCFPFLVIFSVSLSLNGPSTLVKFLMQVNWTSRSDLSRTTERITFLINWFSLLSYSSPT